MPLKAEAKFTNRKRAAFSLYIYEYAEAYNVIKFTKFSKFCYKTANNDRRNYNDP